MKRQHSSDDEEKAAKQKLDLNSTPRGFDLNAPFPEEDIDWTDKSRIESSDSDFFTHILQPAAELGIDGDLDLLHSIWTAYFQRDHQRLDEILVSLCEEIGKSPSSPSKYHYLTCFYTSTKLPHAFTLPKTYQTLLAFLDSSAAGGSAKKQNLLPVISCKLLFRAYSEKSEWPLDFVKVYLEDAITSRNWVDSEHCKEFVANVITAFRDDLQDIAMDDIQGSLSDTPAKFDTGQSNQISVRNRYIGEEIRQNAKIDFLQALSQLLQAPLSRENPRILFKVLMLGVCYEEVRVSASNMLEPWLNNPLNFRNAKLLLDRILYYTRGTAASDYETIGNILALRLSNQGIAQMKNPLNSLYTEVVFHIVQKRAEYSSLALKIFLSAELTNKGYQNIKGISTVLKALPDNLSPERELALVIKELALNEEFASRLQDVISRLTKQLSSSFLLSRALLEPWPVIQEQPEPIKQSWFKQIIGLACHLLIQSAVPFASDEKFLQALSSDDEQLSNESFEERFEDFTIKVMTFQVEALTWCTDVLNANVHSTDSSGFCAFVRTLMFLKPLEEYLSGSNTEVELNAFQLVAFSMHASEEILARVILMGISNQFPMLQEDALQIIESLVWRAVAAKKHMFGTLFADSIQLPAAIMKLSSFNLPNLVRQPLPQVVLKDMYWRSCLVILAIAVYNPPIGKNVWETLPAIRYLLEFLITGTINLSDLIKLEDKDNDIKAEEVVEAFLEKELGSNLEADLRSKWRGNVMLNDNYTNKRMPPKYVFEEVEEIDKIYSLGRTLRTCKKFNFLGDMLNIQNFKEAWTWIKRAVSKEPEIVGMLPSNWQCKLLYLHERTKSLSPLVQEFQVNLGKLIKDDESSESEIISVIKFFSEKLTSKNSDIRSSGRRCFAGILSSYDPLEDSCTGWFNVIEGLKSSKIILDLLVPVLQEALVNESSIRVIWSYLVLLKKYLPLPSFTYSISRLLIERKLLSYGLLSVSSRDIINGSNDEGIFPIMDVYLDTFSEVCLRDVLEWEEEHLPLVKIVLGEDKSLSVASIVLEAMVEISSYVGSNDHNKSKETYARIVEFLFEKTTYFQQHGQKGAFGTGQGGCNLSKDQTVNLARTKDTRLIKAGLSEMNLAEKLKLLRELGLSSEAKGYILEELEALSDSSANSIIQPLSNSERFFLLGCFPTLSSKFPNILGDLDQPEASESSSVIRDGKQPYIQPSFAYEMEEKVSCEDIIKSTLEEVSHTTEDTVYSLQNYLTFRILLQRSAMVENVANERLLERIYEALNSVDASSLTRLTSLLTPVLILVANQKIVEHQTSNEFVKKLLSTISAGVKQGLSGALLVKRISELQNAMETEYTSKDKTKIVLQSFMHGKPEKLKKLLGQKIGGSYEQELLGIISILKEGLALEVCADVDPKIELAGRLVLVAGILFNFDPLAASEQWLLKSSNTNPVENEKEMLCTTLLLQYAAQNIRGSSLASLTSRLCTQYSDHVSAPVMLDFLSNQDFCASFMSSSKTSWPRIFANLAANVKECPLKPFIYASSNGCHVLQALVKHLLLLAGSHESVQHVIHGLYVAFPVTVGSILDDTHRPDLSLRASNLYYIVRDALNAVFSSRKSSAAYDLCYYVAKKHPAFIIQRVPTLRLHLEENLTKIKEANLEQLTSIANLFLFTLELLDAARPLVYAAAYSVNSEVYTLLLVYLQALEAVPSSYESQFAKFAVKLAKFISVGLSSNAARISSSDTAGVFSERVQRAFQRFGHARKVTELLERLKDIPASQRDILVSATAVDESAMEKIEQVKNILANFWRLEACEDSDQPWDVVGINSYKESFESGGKLLSTLTDIDTASGHIPGILENMQNSLIDLLKLEDVDILDKTYTLLARMLQYGSRSANAGAVASAVLEQLDSNQGQRLEIATRYIGKLFHYFEELQEGILMKMFRSGKDSCESLVEIITDTSAIVNTRLDS